ncbi:B-type cyclin [Basidiobolus ranarum]|uniref:B-type cyclin n=1 Tax=Basidiobolus ranarum TaxID=34480 RepID=A0ABR2WRB9_9FUNG
MESVQVFSRRESTALQSSLVPKESGLSSKVAIFPSGTAHKQSANTTDTRTTRRSKQILEDISNIKPAKIHKHVDISQHQVPHSHISRKEGSELSPEDSRIHEEVITLVQELDPLQTPAEDRFSFSSPYEDSSLIESKTTDNTALLSDTENRRLAVEFDEFIDMESDTNSSHLDERDTAIERIESDPTYHCVEEMDRKDISMVSDYADDIFEYWRELEQKMKPNPNYMSRQSELEWHMRGILLDWLVQVHERFGMLQETLFLSVNYIDRFLSLKEVSIEKLQLVGTTALFIAAKYEEIAAPTINEMIYMVSGTYTCDELKKAERFMINLLNYELGFPGPLSFLRCLLDPLDTSQNP